MLIAVWMRTMRTFQQDLEEAIASTFTARDKLEALLSSLKANWHHVRIQTLFSFFRDEDLQRFVADKRGLLDSMQQQLLTAITTLFEEGKAR